MRLLRPRETNNRQIGSDCFQISKDIGALLSREIEQYDVRPQIADASEGFVVIADSGDDNEPRALRQHQCEAFPV